MGNRYIGSHGITQIEVRDQNNPFIRVVFERALDPEVKRQLIEDAAPFRVKFSDTVLRQRLRYQHK